MLYDRMKKEHQRLQKEIKTIQKQLKPLPPGKLICSHYDKYYKCYHSDGKKRTHIPKNNRSYAEELAKKKYLTYRLEDLLAEERAINYYLRHHKTDSGKADKLLMNFPGYRDLLSPYFQPKSKILSNWMNEPYPTNTAYPEGLKHKTITGSYVRSKSESLILLSLHNHRIPFRYECKLALGTHTLCPDFTLLHPKTQELYYWEHFGLMDEPEYAKRACEKIQLYAAHGIYPSVNLIITWETKDNPLSSEIVENMIQYYFL